MKKFKENDVVVVLINVGNYCQEGDLGLVICQTDLAGYFVQIDEECCNKYFLENEIEKIDEL